ncbi:unnamed protein product [Blepharisma stoltei]|uniref:Uncharacterized protein n=1 Tax=Blepharisma stoltei TaxID=1481888 RepID=A0AAU9JGA4_9CILI|nr:unnamed protein product [Blepharisma stoltei]
MEIGERLNTLKSELNLSENDEKDLKYNLARVDFYIHKFEIEKRSGENLDEQLEILRNKIIKKRAQLSQSQQRENNTKAEKKFDSLYDNITLTKAKLGQLRKETEEIKNKIQLLRRFNMIAEKKRYEINTEISRSKSASRSLINSATANVSIIRSTKSVMGKLNKSFKTDFQDSKFKESMLYAQLRDCKSVTPKVKRPRTPFAEISVYLKLLKFLGKKWIKATKERSLQIKEYQSHIKDISRALFAIGNSISSHDVAEIAKMHSSSYDQELRLRCHILEISENIEKIEKKLANTEMKIKAISNSSQSVDYHKINFVSAKKGELSKVKEKIEKKNNQHKECEDGIKYYMKILTELSSSLKTICPFKPTIGFPDEEISWKNQDVYMSATEEMIKWLSHGYSSITGEKSDTFDSIISTSTSPHSKFDFQLKKVESGIFTQNFDEIQTPLSLTDLRHNARWHLSKFASSKQLH